MNNDSPFTVHGDETLEARIVAWVLGEASSFEAAELERLCEERPELLVFRRRMRALHGLLTEAEAAQPDEGWKLPEEKRRVLDEIFGEQQPIRLEVEKEKRIRHSGRRALLAIAACLMLALVVMRLMPWKQVAEAEITLEVKSRPVGMSPLGAQMSEVSGAYRSTPNFFGTEFEKIKSRNSLEKVVDNLDLAERWGVDKETALRRVKSSIQTENVRGTDLISIRVREPSQADARDIADEVAKTYKAYRQESENRNAEQMVHELNKAVRDQEDKVEERRKVLATIVRTKGVIYKGADSFYAQSGVDEDQGAKNALQTFHQLEQEKTQLESQLADLSKNDGNQPAQDAEDRKAILKAKLDQTTESLKSVEVMKDETREEAIKRGLDAQDYVDAKREFETDQELLQTMKLKLIGEEISGKMPRDSVEVHDQPVIASKKISVLDAAASGVRKWFSNSETLPSEMAAEKKVDFMPAAPAGATSESLVNQKKRAVALAPERTRSNVARVMAEGAKSEHDLGELAADDSLRSIEGVSTFESKRAPGGQSGGVGSGSLFGLQANQAPAATPPPPAAPASSPEPAAKAKLSKDMAGIDAEPNTATPAADTAGGFGGGGGGADPFAEPADRPMSGGVDHRFARRGSSDLDEAAPPPTLGRRGGEQPADVALGVVAGQSLSYAGKKMEAAEKVPVLGDRLTSATDKTVSEGIPVIDTRSAGIKPPGQPKPAAAVTAGTMMLSGGIAMQQSESQLGVKTDVATPKDSKPAGEEQSKSNLAKGDLSSFAQREMTRRQETLAEGEQLLKEGRDSYAKGDYQQAVEKYTKILEKVPDSPMFADRRENYISHLSDASVALAMQNRKVGKYDEARKLLDNVIAADPNNDVAKRELNFLDDPLRTNPALTNEHTANVDKVRRSLYTAEGNYNLGKYDDAKREYEEALRTDPYNAAARRGLERIASAKTDYYRAAYDHTRAELLSQVDNAWELSIPADGEKGAKESPKDLDGLANNGVTIESKPAEGTKTDELATSDKELSDLESDARQRVAKLPAIRGMIVDRREQNAAAPKPDLTKLMEEIAATEDPYSTFSLNISDASFQVAQAALAKGERPDPAGIKVEQFYNAVDYGDPAPSAGEPVAVNIEQSAHPVVPGRNLVRVALKTAAAGRSAAQPLRLTLLVDQSGSMVREDRRAAMDKALAGLAGLLTDKDLVTVVGFSRTPRLLADGLAGDKAGKLADLVNQSANEGGTNLEEAIKLGEQLADRSKLAGAQNRIVLFTDGAANLGNADPVRLAEKVKQLRQKGIAFDIAGIAADGLNDELLGELARNGNGRYYVVGKGADESLAKQLAGAFRPAAENVKVQVHFNPERVGRYKLIGFEKDRLKTEDFRNDAVDAAELAAEEAGVAVYQVEPLPGGNGELGEVSVRFRDAASSQMVERTWTIPHDDKAPAFDRAAPSMQLAVLSMLAAEKLKGGPLGDAIDFKQLAEPRANVKRFYGTAGRVGEVLNMVDALK